ncbi:1-acyl-sn-glycerol-3-phosphate acyltransferase [Pollutibacter soli]|uniref:1-acyl-sn-glycerol-3-phosphate acyltransferase n=1 Tax=Pollutibacter soli TaxID=3034157 RepID=UPI003013ECE8
MKNKPAYFLALVLSFVVVSWLASGIHLEEDISRILPADEKLSKLNQVFRESKFADQLVLRIGLKDSTKTEPDSLVAYADVLLPAIDKSIRPYIKSIQSAADPEDAIALVKDIQDHLPYYLEENDYQRLDSLITPDAIHQTLQQNIRTLSSPMGMAMGEVISRDPVGISYPALRNLEKLNADDNLELYNGYLVSKDHRDLMVMITPSFPPGNTGQNALFLRGLDSLINHYHANGFSHIDAGYFGATAVSTGNALQLRKDAMLTQGITLLFLVLFFAFYFRKRRAPLLILLPVAFGALFSLAAIRLIDGSISVIALGAGSIVLGIAVNYSLHVFNHYRHVRNMETVISDLTLPMTVGGFTTIAGFLSLQFTDSAMLADLGLFAAFSLIGAALASLIFLPPLAAEKNHQPVTVNKSKSWIDRFSGYRFEYNRWLVLGIIALTILFSFYAGKAGFESEMMNMNYMSSTLRKSESQISRINADALQSVYLVTEGKTLEEALRRSEKKQSVLDSLVKNGTVRKYAGLSSAMISDSLRKTRVARWNTFWDEKKKQSLFRQLDKEGKSLGYNPTAFEQFRELLSKDYTIPDTNSRNYISDAALSGYLAQTPDHVSLYTLIKVAPGKRAEIYAALGESEGQVVMDKQYITSRLVEIVNKDFTRIALITSILVFVVLLITYGRIELALVAFIPMVITWIWILGIMGMAGLKFNIVNIIISALIFALGDDYSLFIMDGLVNEYRAGKKTLASFKSSIVLSALTTITGLGVLIFAKHPALRSIAVISIIGIASVALIAQVMIPFFFSLIIRNRVAKKYFPWTFTGFLTSVFAFTYFVLGCILCTLLGLVLYLFKPFGKEKVKLFYHRVISKYCWSVMYIMGNHEKKIFNTTNEDFKKPAVLIANHQSFLDILCMIMLHPKLILFTNKWVWNSPVFGAVVRMADYFPVARGVENGIGQIAERVKEGYSVVIFPEGTRTPDGVMKRFHKGAFFLAEQLNLDIIPVVIHGTGYTMTKGDFLLKNGQISLKILPRITPDDNRFGQGYAERAKLIGRFFRSEFANLKAEIETPDYFREKLKYNFIYKGPVLEWYMRIKTRLEKNYKSFNEIVPKKGKILDVGCGYGFMSYMLAFSSAEREITGIDFDDDKISTARHCFSRNEEINFETADIMQFRFGNYDCIILADMLHYLQPGQQKLILEKCIRQLNVRGTIVIRDGNKELVEKHKGTVLTEFFSTKLIGFNKTSAKGLSFLSGEMVRELARNYGLQITEIDETKYTSNMLFILKKEKDVNYASV